MKTEEVIYGCKGVQYDLNTKEFYCQVLRKSKLRRKNYALNVKVKQRGKIKICKNGLHFSSTLKQVTRFYPLSMHSFYFQIKVDIGAEIDFEEMVLDYVGKCATSELTPIKLFKNSSVLKELKFYNASSDNKKRIYGKHIRSERIELTHKIKEMYKIVFETPEAKEKFEENQKKYKRFTINYSLYEKPYHRVILIK